MSSKKYRLKDDVKRRIKERLNRNRAQTHELLHDNSLSSSTSCTDTEDEAMVENYKTSNCSKSSRLATIIKRLWTLNPVGSANKSSEKVYATEHAGCFLRRNIKAIDKERRLGNLGHKIPTPKRKKRRPQLTFNLKKKKITTSGPDFYFKFRKRHSIHSDTRCNDTDRPPSAPMPPEMTGVKRAYETCSMGGRPELDPQEKQWYCVPLFPKRSHRWKSLVRENDDCPD